MKNKAIKMMLGENTLFDVCYLDGVVKRYDILALSDKFPQLNKLKDRSLFEKGKLLGSSAIYWNEDLDIDVDTVYEEGTDVTCEYDSDLIVAAIIGYKIKTKRLQLFMSQEELAKKTGIDQSDLSKIEKGLANPTIKMINRIAKGLNTCIDVSLR